MRFWSLTKKTPVRTATAEETFQFAGVTVKVIRRSGLKNLTLRVRNENEFKLTAPHRVARKYLLEFLQSRESWIEEQKKRFLELREWTHRQGEAGEKYWYLGDLLTLKDGYTLQKKALIELQDSVLWYHWPAQQFNDRDRHREQARGQIRSFWEARARQVLTERVQHYSAQMGVSPSALSFRNQRSRWGSCTSKGRLSLNLKLIGAPLEVVDSVVVHELSHLIHLNHSRDFWDLVERYAPQHRQADQWLAAHHQQLLP